MKRESERIENGRERMRMLNEGNPIRTMYLYAPLCQPHLTDDQVKGSHSQYLCACALGFVHLSVEDHACKGLYVYVNNIRRWRTFLSGQGSPERFPWEAEKNHYSLRPVGDVAKHEAASVIGQPADHKGYHHSSWTQGTESTDVASVIEEAKYQLDRYIKKQMHT